MKKWMDFPDLLENDDRLTVNFTKEDTRLDVFQDEMVATVIISRKETIKLRDFLTQMLDGK